MVMTCVDQEPEPKHVRIKFLKSDLPYFLLFLSFKYLPTCILDVSCAIMSQDFRDRIGKKRGVRETGRQDLAMATQSS